MTIPADLKAQLRRTVMARRKEVHAQEGGKAAADVQRRVCEAIPSKGQKIAGYWPLGCEIDCRPALEGLINNGAQVGLPVVAGQGQVLIFRCWQPGVILDVGPFGTWHPTPRAPLLAPTVLLLPLIAFDNTGHRLGYGAGYYDRTIAALRQDRALLMIGIAYDAQEVEVVPVDSHDQRMDAVITERRTLWFNEAARLT